VGPARSTLQEVGLLIALGAMLGKLLADQRRRILAGQRVIRAQRRPPLPGARDLLVAIMERGHCLVLASSGQQRHVDVFLDRLDARDLVEDWTTGDDVRSPSPPQTCSRWR
jgi:beta-phosphoglucomutase-like phosphatase (HAD superfamily)